VAFCFMGGKVKGNGSQIRQIIQISQIYRLNFRGEGSRRGRREGVDHRLGRLYKFHRFTD